MNINVQNITGTFFGSYSVFSHKGLKSTEEKLERQEKRDSEVAFFEKQKEIFSARSIFGYFLFYIMHYGFRLRGGIPYMGPKIHKSNVP